MAVANSDPRVADAVKRWLELPRDKPGQLARGLWFIASPEGNGGVLVETRDGHRFACIDNQPNRGPHNISVPRQPTSAAPDVTVRFQGERYPVCYFGDPRIIGAFATTISALLLVNFGMEVAFVRFSHGDPLGASVVWSGPGSRVPELDYPGNGSFMSRSTQMPALSRPLEPAPFEAKPSATATSPVPTPSSSFGTPPAPTPSSSVGTSSPVSSAASRNPVESLPVFPRADAPLPPMPFAGPRKTAATPAMGSSPPGTSTPTSPVTSAAPRPSDVTPVVIPRADTSATEPAANRDADRVRPAATSSAGALAPVVLSEEVTVVLVRHLRHAATQLPIAKGSDVAREWLVALERACGDLSGIGDVVGGSRVLFAPLHSGGHLAVMPSAVSAHAAAGLLVGVTPLVEHVSQRRWALRISALLDPQSIISRKLARRAPGMCRLASTAPPAPTSTRRAHKSGPRGTDKKPATRKSRTAELETQLAMANAEIERLRADFTELRQAEDVRRRAEVSGPDREPSASDASAAEADGRGPVARPR